MVECCASLHWLAAVVARVELNNNMKIKKTTTSMHRTTEAPRKLISQAAGEVFDLFVRHYLQLLE